MKTNKEMLISQIQEYKKTKDGATLLEILNLCIEKDWVIYPDPDYNFWAFDRAWIIKHEHTYIQSIDRMLPLLNFKEWCHLEDLLGTTLIYLEYEKLADFCQWSTEINGDILRINEKDTLQIGRIGNALRDIR